MPIQTLIADDHAVVRQGIRTHLEREGLTVAGEASDGAEAVRLAQLLQPEVAILDFSMPLLSGLEAAQEITRVSPRTRIILLSFHTEPPYVREAMQAGVAGCVHKARLANELVPAVRGVSEGFTYLSPRLCRTLVDAWRKQHPSPSPCC